MLPNILPSGRPVEVSLVVIVHFDDNNEVETEQIYWDQASVLVQIGLLDPLGLPVTGAESARKCLEFANLANMSR